MKRLDELKKGKFVIVTDHGNFNSYFDYSLPIFCMVPNSYKILGFIQDDNPITIKLPTFKY